MRRLLQTGGRVAWTGARRLSARSSGGSSPRGLARVCRCVRSSNGGHTAPRRAKAEQPTWRPGPSQVEPPIWSASSRRSTHLAFRDTGPRASPALRRPCSLCNHLTNSRRAYRQFRSGAAPVAAAASHPAARDPRRRSPAVSLAASLRRPSARSCLSGRLRCSPTLRAHRVRSTPRGSPDLLLEGWAHVDRVIDDVARQATMPREGRATLPYSAADTPPLSARLCR